MYDNQRYADDNCSYGHIILNNVWIQSTRGWEIALPPEHNTLYQISEIILAYACSKSVMVCSGAEESGCKMEKQYESG